MSKAQCESSDNETQHEMCSRFVGVDDGEQECQRDKDQDDNTYTQFELESNGRVLVGSKWVVSTMIFSVCFFCSSYQLLARSSVPVELGQRCIKYV